MHRRRIIETVVSSGVVLALVIAGFLHQGVPAAQVVLNDGGVWVINKRLKLVGHLNAQSRTLDGGAPAGSSAFDVLQAAASVLIDDDGSEAIERIDPSTVELAGRLTKTSLEVSHGGGSVLLGDGTEGAVWAIGSDAISGFNPSQEPLLDEVPGVRVAAAVTGHGVAVEPDGTLHSISFLDEGGGAVLEEAGSMAAQIPPDAELTTVGDDVVFLDRESGTLITPYASISITDADQAVLQQPGPAHTSVLVATTDALYAYPIRGGGGFPS